MKTHPSACLRACASLALAAMLAGCATSRLSNVQRAAAIPAAPAAIMVDAVYAPTGDAKADEAGRWAAAQIGRDLAQRLRKTGFRVVDHGRAPSNVAPALLSVSVHATDRGSFVKRMTIGFGAGRATLSAKVRFAVNGDSQLQLAFDGHAWTQPRPGLVLPVGIALATAGSVRLIPLAASGTLGLREGLGRAVARLDRAILQQLKRRYGEAGWNWPTEAAGDQHGTGA